jgi:putative inorganic carbon (hco3(-)) transporter
LMLYIIFTFGSLCYGSFYLHQPFPIPGTGRFGLWQEYMVMPALLILTLAVSPSKKQIQIMVLLMCIATLALDKSFWNTVTDRDFSSYSEELHEEGGSMGYAGTNGLAAFAAQVSIFLLALAAFERRSLMKSAYYGLTAFSVVCLTYSLARAGYVAFFAGCLVLGVLKQRKLLLLMVVFLLTWTTLVPKAVVQRVNMTYDKQSGEVDHSSATRFSLWSSALDVFETQPIFGTGFETYRFMHLNERTDGGTGYYADTHNYFVKVLVEGGVMGLCILMWLLGSMMRDGYSVFRNAKDPLFRALGLALIGWIICAVAANIFGDRWTFLQVNGYMWVLAAMTARARQLEAAAPVPDVLAANKVAAPVRNSRPRLVARGASL